jgi:hypothetical protein
VVGGGGTSFALPVNWRNAMSVVLREFRAPAGEGDALLAIMRNAATRFVRDGVIDTVVVCQRADSREYALWLEHGTTELPSPSPGATILPGAAVKYVGAPLVLDCVDALYRFPLRSCRVWTPETRQPAVSRALFGLSRTMQSERRIVAISVYRATREPSRAIAFVGMEGDHVPAEVLGDTVWAGGRRGFACYPLVGVWTFGRLVPRPGRSPAARYSRAAFWVQMGVSTMQATDTEAEQPLGVSAARGSSPS